MESFKPTMMRPYTAPLSNYFLLDKASTILSLPDFPHFDGQSIHCLFSSLNSLYTFRVTLYMKSIPFFPNQVTLYLENATENKPPLLCVYFSASILDTKGGCNLPCGCTHTFPQLNGATTNVHLIPRENVLALADKYFHSGDTVKVAVEVLILGETDPAQASPLLTGLSTLLDDFTCSDFLIAIPGKEYRVHKSILAARSPVFRAMLEGEFREATENRVDFEKIDQQVLDSFIGYLYTDQITDIETNAVDLIVLADKYQVESLLLKCGQHLCGQLSVESFCTLLTLSHQHNVPNLKEACVKFFGDNSKEIVSLDEWDTFTVTNLHLLPSLLKVSVLNQ